MDLSNKGKIAVVLQNAVQYYSFAPALDKMIADELDVDIFVPEQLTDDLQKMSDETYEFLLSKGYTVKRSWDEDTQYKILFCTYPTHDIFKLNSKYNVRFQYGFISLPNFSFSYEVNGMFDYILCDGEYDSKYLSYFAKTHIIGNVKYANKISKPKERTDEKPVLLYLPTYGDRGCLHLVAPELAKLKDEYKIVTKLHHGICYLDSEVENKKLAYELFDEVYDSHYNLEQLFCEVDLVFSDESGAVWDAVLCDKAIGLFYNDGYTKFGDNITTLMHECTLNKTIPGTNEPSQIANIIKMLDENTFEKQQHLKKRLFKYSGSEMLERFTELVEKLLKDDVECEYHFTHDQIKNKFIKLYNTYNENKLLQQECAIHRQYIEKLSQEKLDLTARLDLLNNKINTVNNILTGYETIQSAKVAAFSVKFKEEFIKGSFNKKLKILSMKNLQDYNPITKIKKEINGD